MNKTILFFLALMLVTTTACGRGNSNNNPVKEETMATEGNGKVIHLTKADFLAKVYNFCLLYTSPSPRDPKTSRMPSSA